MPCTQGVHKHAGSPAVRWGGCSCSGIGGPSTHKAGSGLKDPGGQGSRCQDSLVLCDLHPVTDPLWVSVSSPKNKGSHPMLFHVGNWLLAEASQLPEETTEVRGPSKHAGAALSETSPGQSERNHRSHLSISYKPLMSSSPFLLPETVGSGS